MLSYIYLYTESNSTTENGLGNRHKGVKFQGEDIHKLCMLFICSILITLSNKISLNLNYAGAE